MKAGTCTVARRWHHHLLSHLTLLQCILVSWERWAMHYAFEYFFQFQWLTRTAWRNVNCRKAVVACGVRGFITSGKTLFLCLQGALEGARRAGKVLIAHLFTEDWRWRSLWTNLLESTTAAKKIIFIHLLQHRGPDYKPSPCETTPFPKQFSHISS